MLSTILDGGHYKKKSQKMSTITLLLKWKVRGFELETVVFKASATHLLNPYHNKASYIVAPLIPDIFSHRKRERGIKYLLLWILSRRHVWLMVDFWVISAKSKRKGPKALTSESNRKITEKQKNITCNSTCKMPTCQQERLKTVIQWKEKNEKATRTG